MTWFWVITLQWNDGGSVTRAKTVTGVLSRSAALETRQAAFPVILASARRSAEVPPTAKPVTLFFSLELDDLTAQGRAA